MNRIRLQMRLSMQRPLSLSLLLSLSLSLLLLLLKGKRAQTQTQVQAWAPQIIRTITHGRKRRRNTNNTHNFDYEHDYEYEYDLVVIGGGASGMFAAGTASSFGTKTLLIDKYSHSNDYTNHDNDDNDDNDTGEDFASTLNLGGDCSNSACVPSKAIRCAAQVVSASTASKYLSTSTSTSASTSDSPITSKSKSKPTTSSMSMSLTAAAAARKHARETTQKVRDRETPKRIASSSPNLDIIFSSSSVSFQSSTDVIVQHPYLFNTTYSGFIPSLAAVAAATNFNFNVSANNNVNVNVNSNTNTNSNSKAKCVRIRGKKFIICTGASPVIPPSIQQSADDIGLQVLTYRSILRPDGEGDISEDLLWKDHGGTKSMTKRIVIIGGGPTACELGQSLARLLQLNQQQQTSTSTSTSNATTTTSITSITIVAPSILGSEDIAARRFARKILNKDGVNIIQRRRAVRVERTQKAGVSVGDQHCEREHEHEHDYESRAVVVLDDNTRVPVDILICATGRQPNVDSLQLDKAGVKWSLEEGVIVNSKLQSVSSKSKHIFAAGDCASAVPRRDRRAAHAGWTGYHSAQSALFPTFLLPNDSVHPVVPRVTFVDPEISSVGLTRAECVERFGKGGFQYLHVGENNTDRADIDSLYRPSSANDGFVELRVSIPKGEILGATICSPASPEIINEIGVAIVNKLTCRDIAKSIHVYPSYGYLMHRAALSLAMGDVWGLLAACGPIGRVAGSIGRNIQGSFQKILLKKKKNVNVRRWESIGAAKEIDLEMDFDFNLNPGIDLHLDNVTLKKLQDVKAISGISFLDASTDKAFCEIIKHFVKDDNMPIPQKEIFMDFIKWLESEPV